MITGLTYWRGELMSIVRCMVEESNSVEVVPLCVVCCHRYLGWATNTELVLHTMLAVCWSNRPPGLLKVTSGFFVTTGTKIKYRVTQKKSKLTKNLITPEMLLSLKQKFSWIMYNLCTTSAKSHFCTTKPLCSTVAQRYVPDAPPDVAGRLGFASPWCNRKGSPH